MHRRTTGEQLKTSIELINSIVEMATGYLYDIFAVHCKVRSKILL